MKKMYIICLVLFVAGIIFYLSYSYSKNNMGLHDYTNETESEPKLRVESMTQTSKNDNLISNITVIKLQTYDLNNDTFSEETINTPVKFLGMSRSDLIEYMKEYLDQPDAEDVKRGLKAFELVQFSTEEVVIRKTFKMENKEAGYYAMLENGYVTIYLEDKKTIYDYTDIPVVDLPDYVIANLNKGIKFDGIRELYEFLETYSS